MRQHRRRGHAAREQRNADALERGAENAKLSLEDRLAKCDMRPGNCKRERARLAEDIKKRDRTVAGPPSKTKRAKTTTKTTS